MHPVTLPGLLEASAEVRPDRVALRDATGAWTYARVRSAVRALTARLRGLGVVPGDRVILVADRRAGAPVAMAAVMAAGAAYVPVDPSWPPARQRAVADVCDPALVLVVDAGTAVTGRLGALALRTADLLGPDAGPDAEPDHGAAARTDGDALAYVIFTSGSTGGPKGVMVAGRSAANLVSSVAGLVGLDERCRLIALSSFSFDISVFEIFATWWSGAELVVAGAEERSPRRLAGLLAGTAPTYLQTTPSVLSSLLDAGLAVPGHTVVLLAGERLPRVLVERIAHVRQVWNLYGPTEATIYATAHPCLPLPAAPAADPPIGRPVAGAVLEVRPTGGGATGGGATGELVIGGPGVARGYLGRPDLSARVFRSGPGGRRYHTGDIVERRADGALAFLGRADRQVKIRGNRVELDEIEAVVAGLLGHANVAVEAVADERLGTHVAAFVVARPGDDIDGLRERVAEVLPAYMVPNRIHRIERVPMTSSGKIDRKALAGAGPEQSGAADPAAVQRWLAELWRDLLGLDATAESNFYALGGQSLLAMRVAAAVEDRYGISLATTTVLRRPVLADLADEIATRLSAGG